MAPVHFMNKIRTQSFDIYFEWLALLGNCNEVYVICGSSNYWMSCLFRGYVPVYQWGSKFFAYVAFLNVSNLAGVACDSNKDQL